jgi:carbonic anhydrase/acetyltransferase-like protein (isoleucine patch superfamily)
LTTAIQEEVVMNNLVNASLRPNPVGDWPQVDPTAHIDPTARIIGNVYIGPEVFVGPYAVIRADETGPDGKVMPLTIGAQCNIQDGVIIHALGGTSVIVGKRTSLSHGCTVHGPCTVGNGCFVGFRSVLYDVVLGDDVFVGSGAVVQGVRLDSNSLVSPACAVLCQEYVLLSVGLTGSNERQFMDRVIAANLKLVKGYNRLNEKGSLERKSRVIMSL